MMQKKYRFNELEFPFLIFLFFILWFLFAFNTENPDKKNYVFFFYALKKLKYYAGLEPGFVFFIKITHKIGFEYQQFILLYSFIGLSLLFNFIVRYSKRPTAVILLFVLYPYFFQIVQIRYFFASCISIWGCHFLIDKKGHYNLKYIFSIVVAGLFHISSVLYLVFLLVNLNYRYLKKIIPIVFFTLIIGEYIGLNVLKSIIPKLEHYISNKTGTRIATKLFFLFYYLVKIHISLFLKKRNKKDENFSTFAIKANLISCLFYVLIWQSMDFQRLEQTLIIHFYILTTNLFSKKRFSFVSSKNFHTVEYYICVIFLIALILVLEFSFSSGQVYQILTNNNFWSSLL